MRPLPLRRIAGLGKGQGEVAQCVVAGMGRAGRATLSVAGSDRPRAVTRKAGGVNRALGSTNAEANGLDPTVLVHNARVPVVHDGQPLVGNGGVTEFAHAAFVRVAALGFSTFQEGSPLGKVQDVGQAALQAATSG